MNRESTAHYLAISLLLLTGALPVLCAQFAMPGYDPVMLFPEHAALAGTRMTLAFDGASFWSSSGGGTLGVRLARYDAFGIFREDFAPGIDFRSIWTEGSMPPVYAKDCGGAQLLVQVGPGSFGSDVGLVGGAIGCDEAVVFDGNGDFIAKEGGASTTVDVWDRATGNLIGSAALSGYGSLFGESAFPQNRGVVSAGGFYLTYSNQVLSAWDPLSGARLGTTVLMGAGTSADSHFSFSMARGLLWVVDGPGGLWRGYDVGISPPAGPAVLEADLVEAVPLTVLRGQTGVVVDVTVSNTGLADATALSASLMFSGSVDRTSEYVVTPSPANPTSLARGSTETLRFSISVDPQAAYEAIAIDASVTATDVLTGGILFDPSASIRDSWLVVCGAPLCGDCNGDSRVSILDAFAAAQHSASLITLVGPAFSGCNVIGAVEQDPLAVVDILDALQIAQRAVGLPVVLACC